ncbi:hypothetical protein JOE31_000812 [Arthrobacter sp. PvP023]|uniref:hypothetical protein n=1 Tax=Micrococcaceae TaxID=1268 RepID=UPI001AE23043|nr:hypothetical protein [Arthrobacter sp. PvP023]MBP1134580.1 hypothetical protein [Arthrobacter sp. PvP023]
MRGNASWLPSALRSLVLATLLAAAWVVFGAVSSQASSLLPPVTDPISADTAASVISEAGTEDQGHLAALTEPVATVAGPIAPQVQAIAEPVLVPVDTAVAPVAAVVEQVTSAVAPATALASDAVAPVTQTVAGITAPVTGLVADVTEPVLAPVGSVAGDVAGNAVDAVPAPVDVPAQPYPAGSVPQEPAPGGAATSPAAAPSAGISPTVSAGAQDQGAATAAKSDGGSTVVMTARTPAPERPATPAPGSPATAPTGSGSLLRAGNDGGSGVAADVPAFQFSLTQISLKDVLNASDELPSSVSLEHGFSPD